MSPNDRVFSELELRRYSGDDQPMYVAFQGVVYEVTGCQHWLSGLHEGLHFPGQDLSDEMEDAPHGAEVFSRPCVKRVGVLTAPEA